MSAMRLCLTDPSLRAAGLIMVLQGAIVCSFGPYFSTLAVHSYGFGDRGYAVLPDEVASIIIVIGRL